MPVEAHPGLWAGWPALASDAPLLASPPWMGLRAGKMDGDTTTFVATRNGQAVAGLFATVAASDAIDGAFDLRELLTASPRTLPEDDVGAEVRATFKEETGAGDPSLWYPHLSVVYPGYECFVVGPERESPDVVAELVDATVEWSADRNLAAVAFLYTVPDQTILANALDKAGFTEWHLTYACDLDLEGSRFEDYLDRLSPKQRREVGRERRNLARRGVSTTTATAGAVVDDLIGLRLQHAVRYGRRVSEEKERARLTQLIDLFGEERVLVFASSGPDGNLVSFSLVLDYGGEWYVLDSGADYSDPLHRLAYFDDCYYAPVARAYETGVRTIHLGLGSWEAKRHRGCALVPRRGWVRALTPELEALLAEWLPRFPTG